MNYFFEIYDHIDSLDGQIPDEVYFPYFADIASRARAIVSHVPKEDIKRVAFLIDHLIEQHRSKMASAGGADPAASMSDRRILMQCFIDRGVDDNYAKFSISPFFPDCEELYWHKYEFMSIFSLMKIADAMLLFKAKFSDWVSSLSPRQKLRLRLRSKENTRSKIEWNIKVRFLKKAGEFSLEALQALNDAERLKDEYDAEIARQAKQSEIAEGMNSARHKQTHEAKEKVLLDWDAKWSSFPSAAKAGNHYANWLREEGLKPHEPMTITGWIRTHAKKQGRRLR